MWFYSIAVVGEWNYLYEHFPDLNLEALFLDWRNVILGRGVRFEQDIDKHLMTWPWDEKVKKYAFVKIYAGKWG